MSIDQYSSTPANNDLTNYFKTGMRPSAVKTAGWDMMADMKDNLWALPVVGGTANAVTLSSSRAVGGTNPFAGQQHWFIPTAANTGSTTLKVDSQSAKNVFAYGAALLGGELQPNVPALVKYDGVQWNLVNPNDAAGSITVSLSGMTSVVSAQTNWRIVRGKTVYITTLSQTSGTSNSNTMLGTGIPSALNPVTVKNVLCRVRDAGSAQFGSVDVGSSGTWTFHNGPLITGGGFTNSGLKRLDVTEFSYTLD